MKTKHIDKDIDYAEYYDRNEALGNIVDKDVELSLDDALRKYIIICRRKRKLRNISIKIDPLYLQSVKKIATRKGIPYQTIVRQWLTEKIRNENSLRR